MSQGVAILVFVLVEALERVETAANAVLAAVNDGSLSNAEARQVLAVCKPAIAALVTAQTSAARVIAGTERHGDGGAQVLADSAGLTRREAHSQIKTAETLSAAPVLRDAVESGRVSPANAKRLAEAISKTDADTVVSDGGLLAQAVSLRPEQFTRVARRWTADHQTDGGEGDYRQMRSRRRVWFMDGEDGMTHMHAEFDPLTGQRIANRLTHAARRLHSGDQRSLPKDQRRTLPQCLADALDDFTAGTANSDTLASGSETRTADICVVAHVDDETGRLIGELPDGSRLPRSVLDELACNAMITGAVFDRRGKAIWKTSASRRATETQRRILNTKWGGCFHCRANFAICQPHHIEPFSRGGPTRIDNLVPACWACHQLIHRDGWQIHRSPDGNHTLHPPQRVHHGPAHTPEQPPPVIADPPMLTGPPPVAEPPMLTGPPLVAEPSMFTTSPEPQPRPAWRRHGGRYRDDETSGTALPTEPPARAGPAVAQCGLWETEVGP